MKKSKKTAKSDEPDFMTKLRKVQAENGGTSRIQFDIQVPKGKMVSSIFREFETVERAREYLQEFVGKEDITKASKNGRNATLETGATVRTNYNFHSVLVGKAPGGKLPDIADPRDRHNIRMPMPSPTVDKEGNVTKMANNSRKRSSNGNGATVPLKKICQDIEMDPRKARQILRRAAKADKLPHDMRGRWEFNADEQEQIIEILTGRESPNKAKPPKSSEPKTKVTSKVKSKVKSKIRPKAKSKGKSKGAAASA